MGKVKSPPLPDLHGPFKAEPLLELRIGKMNPMPNLTITSGINKLPVSKNLRHWVTPVGEYYVFHTLIERDSYAKGSPYTYFQECDPKLHDSWTYMDCLQEFPKTSTT